MLDKMDPQTVDTAPAADIEQTKEEPQHRESIEDYEKTEVAPHREDAFGNEEFAEVKYKVLKWW